MVRVRVGVRVRARVTVTVRVTGGSVDREIPGFALPSQVTLARTHLPGSVAVKG